MISDEDLITPALEILTELEPSVVYLFGSAAAGRLRPDSDLDLAFLTKHGTGPVELFDLSNRIADRIGREVDLIDLSQASTVMRKEVVATGRVVDCSDPRARAEFEMYALSDYARLNEERRESLAP